MYKYKLGTIKAIHEFYEDYCAYGITLRSNWEHLVEEKADFDTAYKKLEWWEKDILRDEWALDVEKNMVYRRMADWLNGKDKSSKRD